MKINKTVLYTVLALLALSVVAVAFNQYWLLIPVGIVAILALAFVVWLYVYEKRG